MNRNWVRFTHSLLYRPFTRISFTRPLANFLYRLNHKNHELLFPRTLSTCTASESKYLLDTENNYKQYTLAELKATTKKLKTKFCTTKKFHKRLIDQKKALFGRKKKLASVKQKMLQKVPNNVLKATIGYIKQQSKAYLIKTADKERQLKLFSADPIVVPPVPTTISPYKVFVDTYYPPPVENLPVSSKLSTKNSMVKYMSHWRNSSNQTKLECTQKANHINQSNAKLLAHWWDTTDPNLIKMENFRRKIFNSNLSGQVSNKLPKLIDPRLPKLPGSAYTIFIKDYKSKNFSLHKKSCHLQSTTPPIQSYNQKMSLIWKNLPQTEKDLYLMQHKQQLMTYLSHKSSLK
ncbi:hypothetical protein BB561_000838 [Smittium simulii]|uniref:HMG box domain-containing protein n=1 Tax=Smittium simulii TaxID=133385 RepID=A0A2T9YXD2_9FUNG|nr:hypothetical protein BB561_000838 [Smittium simulii]